MSDGQGSLFDADALGLTEPPAPLGAGRPSRTRGQIRIARQAQALAARWHPLSLTSAPRLRLHAQAAPADDRRAEGLRCGTCRFRVLAGGHSRAYPKCHWPDPDVWQVGGGWPRATHGDGTDIARWWPACTDYQPAPNKE